MSKSIYAICCTRHYYAPQPNTKRRLVDDQTGEEWVGTRAEARAKIEELDSELYYLSHNESDRPDYTLVRR